MGKQEAKGSYIAQAEGGGKASVNVVYNINQVTSTGKPFQRPPRPEHFIGREAQIKQIQTDLHPGRSITLCGPGGIGKSALAAEVVWRLAPDKDPPGCFPDGIIFHSFYGQPNTEQALEKIARAFGYEPKPTPGDAAQNALAGKRVLLILDGTEDADNLPKVLAVAGGCGILITTRRRKDAVAERKDIAPLEPDEALKLLRAWASGKAEDEAAALGICKQVGGLPLAVRLIGRYLSETGESAAQYLKWLEETPLEALDPYEERHRQDSVPWLLQRSFEQVGEQAQAIMAISGHLALTPFSQNLLNEVLHLPPSILKRAFAQLTGYGLLLHSGDDRYEVSHALIHTYTRKRLSIEPEVLNRLVKHYRKVAQAEAEEGLEGYKRLDIERSHLLQLISGCLDRSEWKAAKGVAWAIGDYLDIRGYWTERVSVNEAGLKAARQLGDRQEEGAWLGNLGLAYWNLGQVEKAIEYHEKALVIDREIGHRRGEGADLGNLGNAYRHLGQVEKARQYLKESLNIFEQIKSPNAKRARQWLKNLDDQQQTGRD